MGKRRTAEDRLRAVAYHEAGHAVAALRFGVDIEKVTIEPGTVEGGSCSDGEQESYIGLVKIGLEMTMDIDRYDTEDFARLQQYCIINLCSRPAEAGFWGRNNNFAGWVDRDHVLDVIKGVFGSSDNGGPLDRAVKAFYRYQAAEAELLIERNWHAVEAVAEALMERKTLTGDEVRAVVLKANLARLPKEQREKLEQHLNGR